MIRPATSSDAPVLLQLIKDLAAYERSEGSVETTEADLEAALFGPEPKVWALIAEHDDTHQPIGMAIYFLSYSTWTGRHGIYLEDLFVQPNQRGRGIGRSLLAALAAQALTLGCRRLEWAVLDWNESAISFYRSLGAQAMDEWTVMRVTGAALTELAGAGSGTA